MKRLTAALILLLTVVILSLSGCGKESISAADIQGTWVRTEDDMISTYTFNSDMTYYHSTETTDEFALFLDEEGTFTLDGNVLTMTDELFGEYSYKLTVSSYELIFTSESGAELVYKKK